MMRNTINRCFLLVLTIPFFVGCSANWHMKKAIAKDPTLLSAPTVVTRWDTITMPQITIVDTVEVPAVGDSVVVQSDSIAVTIKTIVDGNGKKKLAVSAKTTTIRVPHYIRVECPPQVKVLPIPWYYKVYRISFFILIALLLLIALQRFRSSIV